MTDCASTVGSPVFVRNSLPVTPMKSPRSMSSQEHLPRLDAEALLLEVRLHAPGAVAQVDERGLAHVAQRRHPPGDGDEVDRRVRVAEQRHGLSRSVRALEARRIGIDS